MLLFLQALRGGLGSLVKSSLSCSRKQDRRKLNCNTVTVDLPSCPVGEGGVGGLGFVTCGLSGSSGLAGSLK